jgi:hypothetical protein
MLLGRILRFVDRTGTLARSEPDAPTELQRLTRKAS